MTYRGLLPFRIVFYLFYTNSQNLNIMDISSILFKSLTKENKSRAITIAQYFYQSGRCSYSAFLYVMTKPFY